MLKNTHQSYGSISKALHWLIAASVFGLFGLGLWMVELGYYDSWYRTAPHIHKSVGVLLAVAMLARLLWRWYSVLPGHLASHSALEVKTAKLAHWFLYLLIFAIVVSGYLISTADGRAISVFNWFEVPGLGKLFENQEDLAGEIHELLAYAVMALAGLHILGALKHHFIDRDATLRRML